MALALNSLEPKNMIIAIRNLRMTGRDSQGGLHHPLLPAPARKNDSTPIHSHV